MTRSSLPNRPLSDPPNHRSCCLRCPAVSSFTRIMDGAWKTSSDTPTSKQTRPSPLDLHDNGLDRHVGAAHALRWSSLGSRGDPSRLDLGFCLTPATQGSTRRICTEGRECTTHHTSNRTSMICELHTPNASCSRKQHVCGEDEEAVAWRPCTTRQAESLFALRVKMTVPEGDVHKPILRLVPWSHE